ncbi:MAG: GAF domain-containing protein [Anaerolineae bacterium]|nr:GAF domain-containing protein [Anaerolineae bacterium]
MTEATVQAAFYLICAILGLTTLGMAAHVWRRLGAGDYTRIAIAAGVLLLGRLAGLLGLLAGWRSGPAYLEWGLECLAVALFVWAFLHGAFASARLAALYLIAFAVGAAGLVAAHLAAPGLLPGAWWPRLGAALLLLLSVGAVFLWGRRRRGLSWLVGAAVVVSLLGAISGLAGLLLAAQLAHLAVLVLFLVATYQAIVTDLSAYGHELQTVSEETLRQTREMAFLLEVSQAVASSLDLSVVLERVSESVTLAMNTNWAYILLSSDDGPGQLAVAARYGWPSRRQAQAGRSPSTAAVRLDEFPLLRQAVLERRQLVANHPDDYEQFGQLHNRLGHSQSGPTLIQPVQIQDRPLGAILVGRRSTGQAFDEADRRLCEALAAQVAAAIDNARLYHSVGEQARRLAELLRAREEEVAQRQAILESITDGVVVAGDAGQVVLVNAAAERILGLSRQQLIGRAISRLYSELLRAGGRRMGDQAVIQWGDRIVKGSMAPVKMPEGTMLGYVAVLRDVTLEQQAEQAKSQFVSTVSHELRTPMTSIKGYTDLLAAGAVGGVSPQQRRFLEIVRANTERMISLVNNLIVVSEMDQGSLQIEPQPVNMAEVIAEAAQAIRAQAGERQLDVVVNLPADLNPVLGDRGRLRQIMDNLLDNAWRYTPANGRITVWAAEANLDGQAGLPPRCVVVNVRDTGVGIAPEDQDRIFARFYRADNPLSVEAGGTGMGLAIVKSLVEAHGGRVWVESQPGAGSTFSFVVPSAL